MSHRRDEEQALNEEVWRTVFHQDDMPQALTVWQRAMQDVVPFRFSYRIRKPDGTMRWFTSKGMPCMNDQGVLQQWACTM